MENKPRDMCECNEGKKGHRHVYCDECGTRINGITLMDDEMGCFVCSDCADLPVIDIFNKEAD